MPQNRSTPRLEGDAKAAVEHRGSHLQIIASAGSGKTEVVSQRVASLLDDGVPAEGIVAFTFTERAAEELKNRIADRVEEKLGPAMLDKLNGLFVGTIHAYCFRLLQQHVPKYETYDVLDENQLTALLAREANRLDLKELDPQGRNRTFAGIEAFLSGVDVVENELLDLASLPDPFGNTLRHYYDTLDRYRLLTYGQQITKAVLELLDPRVRSALHATLQHLIVDEYQDVNPAQEALVELMARGDVELCVVGDDQQAIYQWRGSDVENITTFSERYDSVATFEISTNRRSRPQLIKAANEFSESISDRISKPMEPDRPPTGDEPNLVAWSAEDELAEAGWIAQMILDLADQGVPYRDMAILVRGKSSYRRLIEQFATFGIPVQPGGRSGLFAQPEARVLGRTIVWLTDLDWRDKWGDSGGKVSDKDLLDEHAAVFDLSNAKGRSLQSFLLEWKTAAHQAKRPANLVGEFYELLDVLDIKRWSVSDPTHANRMGTLARFSSLLADYESVRQRARPDAENPGEQVGGQDRGKWYYWNLGTYVLNYAQSEYDGFGGEDDFMLDAVDLTTIHRAKGLEWPVVFVPSMTDKRFPPSKSGTQRAWPIPRDSFNAARYEGGDQDERRLFYVAMTRARDWLSVSRHEKVTTQRAGPSHYYLELSDHETEPETIRFPAIETSSGSADDEDLVLTFSELASFIECGMAFRLRNMLGFQPRLATELGYGKAVHHMMRTIAERTQEAGAVPSTDEIDALFDTNFFLPTANKPAHRQLKEAARRLVHTYATKHQDDLQRVWETERPFELHLDGVTVSGRADVILDQEDGQPDSLAIIDYKTSTSGDISEYALQLQVYADAGRREGLDVRAAYVHDLKSKDRGDIPVEAEDVAKAEETVVRAAEMIRAKKYDPRPGPICRTCEVRTVCPHAKL